MKKKIFDYKLYLEGLRQLRVPGIVLLSISVLLSAIMPIIAWMNQNENPSYQMSVSMLDTTPVLLGYMYLAPLILTMILFSFLNKRNGSDFYHSVPNKRLSIYLSFSAAIATITAGTIIITVLLTSVLWANSGVIFNTEYIPYLLLTYLASALLIQMIVQLAMSVTGTGMNNIIVSGLILFLPRMLGTVYSYTLMRSLSIININEFGIFGNSNYNIPVKFALTLFGISSSAGVQDSDMFTFAGGIIYTFVLALIYLLLGALLFKSRRSEVAGKSAPNRTLQHIFRCAITIPVSLIIPCTIAASKSSDFIFGEDFGTFATVTVVCLIIYFLYEIITTKKIENLVRAIPVLLVVVVFDVIFGFSMVSARNNVLNTQPEAKEIEWVSFKNENTFENYSSNQTKSYKALTTYKIQYKDTELLNIVSDNLKNTISIIKSGNSLGSQRKEDEGYIYTTIKLKNGKKIDRQILLDSQNLNTVRNIKSRNKDYEKAVSSLPDEKNIKSIEVYGLSKDDSKKVWDVFKSEYSKLSLENALFVSYDNANNVKSYSDLQSTISELNTPISINGSYGVENYIGSFRLTALTPKAMQLAADLMNKDSDIIYNTIDKILRGQTDNYSFSLRSVNYLDKTGNSIDINLSGGMYADSQKSDKSVLEIVRNAKGQKVDVLKPFVEIDLITFDKTVRGKSYRGVISLSTEDVTKINDIIKDIESKNKQQS